MICNRVNAFDNDQFQYRLKQYTLIVEFMKLLAHTGRITCHKFKSLIKMLNLI
jgi:hypothetical protein